MKKFLNFTAVFVLIFTISILNVSAQEFYKNDNGVTFTKEEYDFFTEMYYDGYQATMTQEERNRFGQNLNAKDVEKVVYEDNEYKPGSYYLRASYHETQAKILQIAKYGSVLPTIAITAQWKYSPNVRSYDLIGAYLSGVTMASGIASKINYSGGTIWPSAEVTASNGFGSVLKLPTSGSNIVASTTFDVNGSGTVFGSYQHAKSTISLNNAKSFSISFSGLGNVHYFSNLNIRNKYDAMQGVSIGV